MTETSLDIDRLFSLREKVALVTGGSRGIGRMITQGLLQAGAKVYISARSIDDCQQAAQELGQYGECIALPADVTDPKSRQQICLQIEANDGLLNILVNNAGTAWGEAYETYPEKAFGKIDGH